jgi:hypothetical protein
MNDAERPEPNPYESPREAEPLTAKLVVKRGLGVGAILLLTPIAVIIAFGTSCGAVNAFMNAYVESPNFGRALVPIALAIFFLPPAITLVAMLCWASVTYRASVLPAKKKHEPNK